MRFNSPEHLQAWAARGTFPRIHDAIYSVVVCHLNGESVLDLGCSYGLLGQRIKTSDRELSVIGVDADDAVILAAKAAGISIDLQALKVTRETLPALMDIIRARQVDAIVARRILPELFGEDIALGREFAQLAAGAGVHQVFVEGRVLAKGATNELASIDREVALLAGSYRERLRAGAVSYLVAR